MRANEEKLVEENIKLPGFVLKKYFPTRMNDEDLYQIGCIGLMTAARKFDASLGYTFSTFAAKVIRYTIIRAIRDECAEKRLINKLAYSLDEIIFSTGEGDVNLTRQVADLETRSPEDEVLRNISLNKIMEAIDGLPLQQQSCFRGYYLEDINQVQLAKMLGIKQVTVSREIKRATKIIKGKIA